MYRYMYLHGLLSESGLLMCPTSASPVRPITCRQVTFHARSGSSLTGTWHLYLDVDRGSAFWASPASSYAQHRHPPFGRSYAQCRHPPFGREAASRYKLREAPYPLPFCVCVSPAPLADLRRTKHIKVADLNECACRLARLPPVPRSRRNT